MWRPRANGAEVVSAAIHWKLGLAGMATGVRFGCGASLATGAGLWWLGEAATGCAV